MTNQHLGGLRAALICATLAALVLVPCTGAWAQQSIDERGNGQLRLTNNASSDSSNVSHPRLYPRASYVWPYGEGPYYGDVSPIAIAEGVPGVIVTEVGSFNLAYGALPIPDELKTPNRLSESGIQYFFVATSGELDSVRDTIAKIEANGGTVVDDLGNGTLVARLTVPAYAKIADGVGMMAIEPYHAAFKISPHIGREPLPDPIKAMSEVYELDVMLWPGESGEATAAAIAKLGATVHAVMGDQIRVEAHRSLLPKLAALEPVHMIHEVLPVYAHAEETTTTMQTGQYNQGAIPYHAAGVTGGGGNFGICSTGGAVCDISSPPGGCGTCTPRPQILMVLDSGIQLDAGDLSHTATSVGTVGPTHRKVLAYESTAQFGGVGDLLGCDAPAQGGFTHGHTVSTTALGWATDVDLSYGTPWIALDQQGNPWNLDGVAPRAKLIAYDGQITPPTVSCADPLQDTISPGDLWNPVSPPNSALGKAYNAGARVINFSWGTSANTYNTNSTDIDTFLATNRDAMVFVSAGNQGQDVDENGIPDPLTVGAPSTAKNSLSIGASRNADTTNQPEAREAFSSVGPAVNATTVNRIAPQLMAPGGEAGAGALGIPSEFSCRSNDNNQTAPVQCDTIQGVEGTSFSAPAAAGAALLVRDYFFQGFYPNRVPTVASAAPVISGALVKAALIASADFMTGANLTEPHRWNNEQGMGRIQLDNVLPLENWPASPTGLIVHDTLNGQINVSNLSLPATVSSGTSHSATFKVCNDQEELRIALAYNDIQNQSLRNNLNLQVTAPTGKVYRGNYFSDDNNRNDVADLLPPEDCPAIGGLTPNGLIDQGQWSLPTCANSAIPGFSNTPVPFDQTNVVEAIYLSPDADNNCNPLTNPAPACYHGGTCIQGGNLNGVGGGRCGNHLDCSIDPVGLSDNPVCSNGTKQPEIGTWTITVSAGTPFTAQAQDFAVVITGGVCVGSTVKFDRGFYTCNQGAEVQVTELAEAFDAGCNAGSCPISTIQNRTTVRAFDPNNVEVDCEGPDCSTPSAGLAFTQPSPQALIFTSTAINLTDGTVPQPGNGTLDIRDGYRIEALYEDVDASLATVQRRSSATVGCQVAIGFGAVQVAQFGQDQSILVQGGCERAEPRIGESQGFFEYGFPDRYMDADELIQFNFAFNSEETQDLENVAAALRCVSIDADSPAECLPNGSGCVAAQCGVTQVCDPRRANNPTCPWMTILDSPKFIGRLPANAAMSANFAIQMESESVFAGATPTVEMLLEISADVAGKTASGLAVSRQRLNIDTTETLYNTDYPTGGVGIVFDLNNSETEQNPITDLAGFQANDYRFETRTYGNLTSGFAANGAPVARNTNLQSPWNFDGGNDGFTNGLASLTDESSAQGSLIANWGEDKNFNGIQDGTCAANSAIACYAFPNDPRCPLSGTCTSIENNNGDGVFTQNRNNLGGCGWQTRPPHVCTLSSTRGCFTTADCAGTCQLPSNSILSTFSQCGSGFPACPSVKQCISTSPTPLAPCTSDANCGGALGSCETVSQTCVDDAGTCNLASTATRGGIWHTGRINNQGVGTCDGSPNSQCANYKVITTTANTLIWWDLLLTPPMEKVDQSEVDGLPNSRIEISYWAWNQATNLRDNNVAYSWEFDTDLATLFPADLIGDGTALQFAVGGLGAVSAENNAELTNGYSMFAPMGRCSGGDGACHLTTDCPAGTCSLNGSISCHNDTQCAGFGTCEGEETCTQLSNTFNGTDAQGNNRVGDNSCFFEGVGTIPPNAFAQLGTSRPIDDDFDNDGDLLIDEFVTAAGPIRNHDIVAFNGPDMRFGTLEDLFGDTGNTFQGAIGLVNFEGDPSNTAQQSYGVGIDDMYVEWREFTLDPDQTSCAGGSCAIMEVPTTNLFQGNNVLSVSLLEPTPYNSACVGGANNGKVCFPASPNCPSGACLPTTNDCDLDGTYNEPGDSNDCNGNGTPDVVVRATSEADVTGVIVALDRQGMNSDEYRGDLSVSLTAESAGTLFLSQNGVDSPTITVTYLDFEDGTGHRCQNSVVPEQQGLVITGTTVFIPDCDVELASTSISDNGDGDFFADTNETVDLTFSVRNNCGIDLTGCSARLSTNSPNVQCILNPIVPLGDLPFDEQGTPIPAPQDFRFKVSSAADRNTLGLDPDDPLNAEFTIAFTCNEIDANSFPQGVNLELDLNLSAQGQTPAQWKEDFETATFGKMANANLDAGIPGANNNEGLINGDDWRCQYSNPDWVLGGAYGDDEALHCYPANTLAHSNAVFWRIDGQTAPHTGPKRAYRGTHSLYMGIFLTNPAGEFTTPMSIVEAAETAQPINLGVGSPELSFWHQISLIDHRSIGPLTPLRSGDRGVVQIQLVDNGGNPTSDWMNLQPIQNSYDEQAADNFFNCMFDPIDDGSTEDDWFDPTDPNRQYGPSSTCFPGFSYGFMGDTNDPFNPANIGNATTPPAASDSPSLGPGTWVESVVDLSAFRGRRARLRFLTSHIKGPFENWQLIFPGLNPGSGDDGWWIDDIAVSETLTNPAQILNDQFNLRSCTVSGNPCIAQCSLSLAPCSATSPCGVGQGTCVAPCPSGQTCSQPAPSCGAGCSSVTVNVFAETETQTVLNPASIATAAPGQVVSFDAADPGTPSSANACLSGVLQYRFCISADPDGGGVGQPPDADCNDVDQNPETPDDVILRGWTENPSLSVAPQGSDSYVVEVRCSSLQSCASSRKIDVTVGCPGGVNALGLSDVRASETSPGVYALTWAGPSIAVDTWTSNAMTDSGGFVGYPGTTTNSVALVNSKSMNDAVGPGQLRGYLVKANGPLNTILLGYFCNSRTWRSGGAAEVLEANPVTPPVWLNPYPAARDETLGNP